MWLFIPVINKEVKMTKKIYVGNLPFRYRGKQLREIFSEIGEVEYVTVILDKNNRGRSKGFGFVEFVKEEDAKKAIQEMDGKEIEGRALKINEATPREKRDSFEKKPVEKTG
jgi:cold-inducible RNA-binding protein